MSPTSIPTTTRSTRPWLAAALMLAVWLTAAPARCDLALDGARLAAASLADPGWHWLQQLLWANLRWRGAAGAPERHAAATPRPAATDRHGLDEAGPPVSDTTGSCGGSDCQPSGQGACGADPNGRCPGPTPVH